LDNITILFFSFLPIVAFKIGEAVALRTSLTIWHMILLCMWLKFITPYY